LWFFRTSIPPVTPVRSLTRCAEPAGLRFIPWHFFVGYGNKTIVRWFTLVCMPGESLPSESFEQLAMPHFDRLYNFACWLTHDRQEAEDLVQETYAKALKGFSSFQQGTNFRAWIYKILRNAFLTSRTGLKATATVPLDLEGEEEALPVDKETPESILLQRSDGQLVQQALEQLPVAYREILLLCEVEEMSYLEISAALSIPMGTVMSRLSRARKALGNGLRPQFQEGRTQR
jgi:RNA polymerase sigma-70 factor, ECF subfamily